eukprot:TRINITY_DN62594_c0_g1_i1.p1 TRINITY_DN62594_c0_g1~~TRINITY_DN62594_c0_g1_i1.p1  ORF type:complete len:186 (+),score=51.54 TRINITY_DN62594_c0_g1_i1:78-635(+)
MAVQAQSSSPGRESDIGEKDFLEADSDKISDETQQSKLGRSDSFDEFERLERLVELDAQHLADDSNPSVESPLRSLREAERLGQDTERGLEAELAREQDSDETRSRSNTQPDSCEASSDPYERQLESQLEDHLCELRVEERRAAAFRGRPEYKEIAGSTLAKEVFLPPDRAVWATGELGLGCEGL